MTALEAVEELGQVPCTCGSDPEGYCPYCGALSTITTFLEKLERLAEDERYSSEFIGIVVRNHYKGGEG